MNKYFNKFAFTLAEVLITLGIIGIVSAMTLPSIVASHRKEVLKAELKKTYNELQRINLSFIKDEGMNICEYNWMLVESGIAVMTASKQTADKFIKYYSGTKGIPKAKWLTDVKTLTGEKADVSMFDDGSVYNLQKKTFYFEYGTPTASKCPVITIDINGHYKKPNQLGIDMFAFRATKNGKVIAMGNPETKRDSANGSGGTNLIECSITSASTRNGMGCAYWASLDISPLDNKKSYWKDFIK